MVGREFDGDDTLYDLPHPYEHVPSWAIRVDGSVDIDALQGNPPGGGEACGGNADRDDGKPGGGGCGYTGSAEHKDAIEAHQALAESDRARGSRGSTPMGVLR
jgi:hypothetical protein